MNYYILPKNNILSFNINVTYNNCIVPYISSSCEFFFNKLKKQVNYFLTEKQLDLFEYINPYVILNSTDLNVSKLSNVNYEFIEVINILNRNDINKITNITIFSPNNEQYIQTITFLKLTSRTIVSNENSDLIIFDDLNHNFINIKHYLKYLIYILKYQTQNGYSIIKIENMYHKCIIDFLYILTSIYDKVSIFKPLVSPITNNFKYLICKRFNCNKQQIDKLLGDIENILNNNTPNLFITSILQQETSYYFLNKIEEVNVIFSQQCLEALDQYINLAKNKNKEDKLKLLKTNNIQKCIQWCEKYQVPYNKIVEKHNIFLNNSKSDDSDNSC